MERYRGAFSKFGGGAALLVFAALSVNRSDVLGVYGGGGKLFGGSYVLELYIGMLVGRELSSRRNTGIRRDIFGAMLSLVLSVCLGVYVICGRFALEQKLPFGAGINPPGIGLMLYGLSVLMMVFYWSDICEKHLKKEVLLARFMSFLGRHSLFLFLCHYQFLVIANNKIPGTNIPEMPWIRLVLYFAFMIFCSIFMECILKYLMKVIVSSYSYVGE